MPNSMLPTSVPMQPDPPDQAAGLRRRSGAQPPDRIYCFFDTAEWTARLAAALHRAGRTSLLIDRRGRLFAAAPARSLFDPKQQLERGVMHTLTLSHGDGWYAPGVRADEPGLCRMTQTYDHLLFDEEPSGAELILMPGAYHTCLIEVQLQPSSMLQTYTLLKTLAHEAETCTIRLLGEPGACMRMRYAANRFLPPAFAQAIDCVGRMDTAFSALAGRMPDEETSRSARC